MFVCVWRYLIVGVWENESRQAFAQNPNPTSSVLLSGAVIAPDSVFLVSDTHAFVSPSVTGNLTTSLTFDGDDSIILMSYGSQIPYFCDIISISSSTPFLSASFVRPLDVDCLPIYYSDDFAATWDRISISDVILAGPTASAALGTHIASS
jgi:hypothetical protein